MEEKQPSSFVFFLCVTKIILNIEHNNIIFSSSSRIMHTTIIILPSQHDRGTMARIVLNYTHFISIGVAQVPSQGVSRQPTRRLLFLLLLLIIIIITPPKIVCSPSSPLCTWTFARKLHHVNFCILLTRQG